MAKYKGTPIITLRLDPEIRQILDAIAQASNATISDIVRLAIMDYLDKNKTDAK